MITVPKVIRTLLPFLFFMWRAEVRRRKSGGWAKLKEECRLEVHGHNGEIKRMYGARKLINEKTALSKKFLNECMVICKIVRKVFSRINYWWWWHLAVGSRIVFLFSLVFWERSRLPQIYLQKRNSLNLCCWHHAKSEAEVLSMATICSNIVQANLTQALLSACILCMNEI
jgi:hypothetical protein